MTAPPRDRRLLLSPSAPPLALLLDVDGPVASPVTRDVQPGIIADLLALAAAGVPVIFNTGRSDAFIREQVMEPMIAAGMPAGTLIHAICEKGAVWFSYTAEGPGPVHVDHELAIRRRSATTSAAWSPRTTPPTCSTTKPSGPWSPWSSTLPSPTRTTGPSRNSSTPTPWVSWSGTGSAWCGWTIMSPIRMTRSTSASIRPSSPPTSNRSGWARTWAPAGPWSSWPPRASPRRPGARWAIPAPTTPWPTGCTTTTTP